MNHWDDVAEALTTASQTSSSEHVFLDKLVFNNVIHETLFFYMTPLEFLRFARICRKVYHIVKSYIKRTFNINRFLTRFFPDPIAFRSLQARTGTLISGSSALQFLDRTFYPKSDLDLYMSTQVAEEVITWLVEAGFDFVPHQWQAQVLSDAVAVLNPDTHDLAIAAFADHPLYASSTIKAVFTFVKPSTDPNGTPLKVQCIVAIVTPMSVICSFHSSM